VQKLLYLNIKWFMNTLGFLMLFGVTSNCMKTMSPQQLSSVERYLGSLMLILWSLCACFYLATVYHYWDNILAFTAAVCFNHSILRLTHDYGLTKQSLGPLLGAMGLWHAVYWRSLSSARKLLFVFFVLLSVPFLVGIRTLLLSLALLGLLLLWGSRRVTFPTKLAIFVCVPLAVTSVLVWREADPRDHIVRRYNRLPSLMFALETSRRHPWGVGNGGYTPYVLSQANLLVSEYAVREYGLVRFPPAPESDIVYFIASFGLLSPVFFVFCGYILSSGLRLVQRCHVSRFEVFLLAFAAIMILGGVSQDFAGKLTWWTYLGAATGIIFRYRTASRMVEQAVALLPKWDGRMSRCPARS
jgi:hypothetical protein